MKIEITAPAKQRMLDYLSRNPAAAGIRFGVKRTGCSGYGYVVDLATASKPGDARIEVEGIPFLIDAASEPLVEGIRIDYRREGMNASFVFDNPNATGECGCGSSFTVQESGSQEH